MNARRVHHCRNCRRETTQQLVRHQPVESLVSISLATVRCTPESEAVNVDAAVVADPEAVCPTCHEPYIDHLAHATPWGRRPEIPDVELWRCQAAGCGIEILSFPDVPDSEGLVLFILNERVRGKGSTRDGGRRESGVHRDSAGLRSTVGPDGKRSVKAFGSDRRVDYEDAHGHLREAVYLAYRRWNPELGVPFLAWATFKLRSALSDWFRGELGRDTPKLMALAESYDSLLANDAPEDGPSWHDGGPADGYAGQDAYDAAGSGLAETLATWEGDPSLDSSPDLAWALGLGGSRELDGEDATDPRPPAASPGDGDVGRGQAPRASERTRAAA